MGDMKKKGRRKHINAGALNGRAKLDSMQVESIRRDYLSGKANQVQLAERFAVSQSLISCIVRGANWV